MASKRDQSISERKQRILAAARIIISREGYDALTTRGLAEAAGVTVPTLYNLVGDKAAIASAMASASIEELWERVQFDRRATPLEMVDAIIDEAYAQIQEDPSFNRATFIALQRLGQSFTFNPERDDPGAQAAERSIELAEFACRAAQQKGQLRGQISPRELAVQMFSAYRAPLDDWINGAIADEEMRRRQRVGFYTLLAADGSDEFRAQLLERTAKLTTKPGKQEAA